jgi:hypothetical protein
MPTAKALGSTLLVSGALVLVLAIVGVGFTADGVPRAVKYANVAGAILDVALGFGVMQRRRGAWAFAVSLFGVLTLVNLLSTPAFLRIGASGYVALAAAVTRAGIGGMLIAERREFSGGSS